MSIVKSFKTQRGISLIEVLIALLVLAVGLLGMLALQAQAIKYNQAAFFEAQAHYAINDIIERVRAGSVGNIDNVANYKISRSDSPTASKNCITSSVACTASELAAWDKYYWYTNVLQKSLPGSSADISFNITTHELAVSVYFSVANLNQKVQGADGDSSIRTITVVTRIQ